MSGFMEVAMMGDLPEGMLKKIRVQDREILLARSGSMVFAAGSRCPHFSADLSKGTLTGTVLTCPSHHSQFDLRDGSVLRWTSLTSIALKAVSLLKPPQPLPVYPVKIEGDRILVSLDRP
jgi:3-phenylpropionate/trans-cinnamate dioxygenase ferredoxin subunit